MSDEFSNNGSVGVVVTQSTLSDKSKTVAALLCFFLGMGGFHRFYLGRVGTGVIILLLTGAGAFTTGLLFGFGLLGIAGLWVVIDFFRILFNGLKDAQGRTLR